MSFRVLFVCTGNICRSPMAAQLFELRTGFREFISVSSAGVNAPVGSAMDPSSARLLRGLGGSPERHRAQRLELRHIDNAHLILTADATHRSAVLRADPLAFRRTFTYREFGHLGRGMGRLESPSLAALQERVAAIASRRGLANPVDPAANDIADPYGMPLKTAQLIAAQISDAVDAIVAALGVERPPDV